MPFIWLKNLCQRVYVCIIFTSECPAASSVWTRWRPPSGRCPSSPYCNVHTGLKILDTRHAWRLKWHQSLFKMCLRVCAERQCARHLHCPRTRAPVLAWCCYSRCSGCSWTAGCWPSCVSCSPQPAKRRHRSLTGSSHSRQTKQWTVADHDHGKQYLLIMISIILFFNTDTKPRNCLLCVYVSNTDFTSHL